MAIQEQVLEGFRISPQQRRLWRLQDGGAPFNAQLALQIDGDLRPDDLEAAFAQLVARHETLRTRLVRGEGLGLPLQVVDRPYSPRWERADLDGGPAEAGRRLRERLEEERRAPLDPEETPPFRLLLARLGDRCHAVVVTLPALLADAVTLRGLAGELSRLYAGEELDDEPLQYADYTEWQLELQESGDPELERAREAARAPARHAPLSLPCEVLAGRNGLFTPRLVERPTREAAAAAERAGVLGVPAADVLLAAWLAFLGRLTGRQDLLVAHRFDGRNYADLSGTCGLVARWIPLSCRLDMDEAFVRLVERIHATVDEARGWQQYFAWEQGDGTPDRPGICFEVDETPAAWEQGGSVFSVLAQHACDEPFGLKLGWLHSGEEWTAVWHYDAGRFHHEDIERLAAGFEALLAAVARDPGGALLDLPILGEAERREIVTGFNTTSRDALPGSAGAAGGVHHLFEAQARRVPQAPALTCGSETLTYAELNERANRLAHHLRALGVGPEVTVGVFTHRSPDTVVSLLAVLKAGGAWVAVEPKQPGARTAAVLEDARAEVVLTQESLRAELSRWTAARTVSIDGDRDEIAARPADDLPAAGHPEDLAYLVFTSGSTGRPKGVAVEHRQLLNYVGGIVERLELPPGARCATVSTFAADLGHTAVFPALATGGHLHVVAADLVADPAGLAELFRRDPVDLLKIVPSHLRSLLSSPEAADLVPGQRLILGGEACPWDLVERVRELAPGCRVFNHYGPSETTVGVLAHEPAPGQADPRQATVPLGRPLANSRVYVLDGALRPVPCWVAGELYLGGAGLSRGYIGRPDLTAARFVPDPAGDEPGARLYRTGDRGRFVAGGLIEFLGRTDDQVKVRGFRVELDEIRAALLGHPDVTDGAVVLHRTRSHQEVLVAHYVAPQPIEARELREALAASLPEEILPNFFVHLQRLPLTPNGKLDRGALPSVDAVQARACALRGVARTPLEASLAGLWAEVLGLGQVGVEDRFFDLGGHSLLATRLIARVQEELRVTVPLRRFLEEPTVAGMAVAVARIRSAQGEGGAPVDDLPVLTPQPAARYEPFPLNEVQQAYWLGRMGTFELGNVSTHAYFEFEREALDRERFEEALQRLIERHDMLRAVVLPDGTQRVLERVPRYEIRTLDLRGRAAEEAEAALAAVREEMTAGVLATDRWPLFDFRLSLLDGGRVRIHASRDALIFDAWSGALLFSEWAALYRDPAAELPRLDLTFRDYVLAESQFHASARYARALEYWRRRIADLPPAPELPLAMSPSALATPRFVHRGASLAPADWQRLKRRAAQAGLTPSGLAAAAFAEILAAWSRNPRFTLNLTLFHRLPLHPQIDRILGDFTSTVLLEVDPAEGDSFELRARRLQERFWEDLEHREVSGVRVLREFARARRRAPGALMPVVLTSVLAVGDEEKDRDRRELMGETAYAIGVTSQVWLDHSILEQDGALLLNWNAVEELFPPGLLDAAFAAYARFLQRLADEEAAWSEPIPQLVPREQLALRTLVNATAVPVPSGLLHQLFQARAAEAPERMAIAAPGRTLTYGEVARRATCLAHRLRGLGARPGSLVGVVMEKGWEQAVAVLGILEAGAAYLPVDPTLPRERRFHLLEHGGVEIALTQPWLEGTLEWPEGLRPIAVGPAEDDGPAAALPPMQRPTDLAYVLFTSGSTGQPKGVMIDHRGALNTVADVNTRFVVGPGDRVLGLSALGFDLSVWDIFGVLGAGGVLVLPEPAAARDPGRWVELIGRWEVTLWNSVPALLEMLVEYAGGRPDLRLGSLRLALLSGDWIPLGLPDRVRALAPEARIVSLGGATEASIWSILFPVDLVDPGWPSIPYGRPMANQTIHVLDERLEPRPVWVPGHFYIGGIGLAQGYWRDEERTRASFFVHPRTGERLYRTGDLARWLPDGDVELLGREDQQVKVQGHRIELGEIEAALAQHPEVRSAVAAAPGPRDHRRLVAYVVPVPAAAAGPAHPLPGQRIEDPLERLRFKLREPGIRRDDGRPALDLVRPDVDAAASRDPERRSRRRFRPEPVPGASFGRFLGALLQVRAVGAAMPRYRYGSAGGLYPVQVYVCVKPERVEGVPGGFFYYHPREHRLVALASGAALDRDAFTAINRPVFDRAAFTLLLVGCMSAIEPLYGEPARHLATIEAGLITQLLETWGPAQGIALCQIGGLSGFGGIAPALGLEPGDVLLHVLVAGNLDPSTTEELDDPEQALLAELKRRVGEETPAPAAGREGFIGRLREHLRSKLPEHMVPATFVLLDELPLTANGKVDRGALPASETAAAPALRVAPRDESEQVIARAWQEVLELAEVGVEDNFFDLGGTSVGMVQVHGKLRASLGRELAMADLFRYPTVASLAAFLARGAEDDAALDEARSHASRQKEFMERQRHLAQRRLGDG